METYAALLNLKLIIPSSKTSYVAVDKNFWHASIAPRISEIDVDEAWYLMRYPDVAIAVQNKTVKSAKQHYCQSGYFEHRMPYQIDVDGEWYLAQYPDVGEAVANKVFSSPQMHFETTGFREGRHPYPEFALRKVAKLQAAE